MRVKKKRREWVEGRERERERRDEDFRGGEKFQIKREEEMCLSVFILRILIF